MTHHVEVDKREVIRYLLGDVTCGKNGSGIFSALLPVPIHIPELDRILEIRSRIYSGRINRQSAVTSQQGFEICR